MGSACVVGLSVCDSHGGFTWIGTRDSLHTEGRGSSPGDAEGKGVVSLKEMAQAWIIEETGAPSSRLISPKRSQRVKGERRSNVKVRSCVHHLYSGPG